MFVFNEYWKIDGFLHFYVYINMSLHYFALYGEILGLIMKPQTKRYQQ